ncbi:hypothetical protein N7478_011816 [Penicillium angulare]|uniref:uncharacterized protein n=1 Tax=Penicillium angulare TaxID=116970 RepID=UPI002540E9A2|nr:uncharacterized protein N7478_011816 [Penicillium angulare]KAJ5261221.1 hypothetical protein N7478_011816 [Penicillium angulare]
MQYDVRSCPLKSDWCREDPKDKKHYKLRTQHLERQIDYVDDGGIPDGHDDVPGDVRRDLTLENQAVAFVISPCGSQVTIGINPSSTIRPGSLVLAS